MKRVTLAVIERLEKRLALARALPLVQTIVRVDRLGRDAVALPGQEIAGNVDAWIIANADRLPARATVQRVVGFDNV